jgi:hypothetical protein
VNQEFLFPNNAGGFYGGITKRDFFAALFLSSWTQKGIASVPSESVRAAIECADALLAELSKPPTPAKANK